MAEEPVDRFLRRVKEATELERHYIEFIPIAEGQAIADALRRE